MINWSFDELRLIAQIRNISAYENKSKEDLTKALSEPKLETPKTKIQKLQIPKPETPQPKIPKPETPKPKIPKPEKAKLEIRINKRKF